MVARVVAGSHGLMLKVRCAPGPMYDATCCIENQCLEAAIAAVDFGSSIGSLGPAVGGCLPPPHSGHGRSKAGREPWVNAEAQWDHLVLLLEVVFHLHILDMVAQELAESHGLMLKVLCALGFLIPENLCPEAAIAALDFSRSLGPALEVLFHRHILDIVVRFSFTAQGLAGSHGLISKTDKMALYTLKNFKWDQREVIFRHLPLSYNYKDMCSILPRLRKRPGTLFFLRYPRLCSARCFLMMP
ncbi:hypothetical protein Cgig2_028154 [Carnegiea gigantea]|uniref:Uncharacterized protein n=1 Tax=Carnegiea gigantea TaxID=171969 RepID=A0A9Q1JZF7_9CARY|nr:hypothetical protein Cgig2_028154 [Carnegiea gigantea]